MDIFRFTSKMGNTNVSAINDFQQTLNNQLIQNINSVTSVSSVGCTATSVNQVTICQSTCGPGPCVNYGDIDQFNGSTQVCDLTSNFQSDIQTNITQSVNAAIATAVTNSQSALGGFLQSSVNTNKSTINSLQSLTNYLQSVTQNNTYSSCTDSLNINAENVINLCGINYGNITQSNLTSQLAVGNCVSGSVIGTLEADSTVSSLVSDLSNYQAAKGTGLDGLFDSLWKILVGGIVFLILLGLIGFLFYYLLSPKKSTTAKASTTTATPAVAAATTPKSA